MNDLNTVLVEGHLVREPEITLISAEHTVCRLCIAVNRNYYNRATKEFNSFPSYFSVEAWGSLAKNCSEYLTKGRGIRVVGRLKQVTWKNKGEGIREKVYIIAEHIEFQPRHDKAAAEPANDSDTVLKSSERPEEGNDTTEAMKVLDCVEQDNAADTAKLDTNEIPKTDESQSVDPQPVAQPEPSKETEPENVNGSFVQENVPEN